MKKVGCSGDLRIKYENKKDITVAFANICSHENHQKTHLFEKKKHNFIAKVTLSPFELHSRLIAIVKHNFKMRSLTFFINWHANNNRCTNMIIAIHSNL